jgi:ABC-type branched-subunit amino acid transport system ATPase component
MRDEGLLPMSEEMILETEDLTKEFAGFVAVNGVSLRVKRGTIHALIGPNGAGKTTCFNLLTKFLSPTRGRILFKGNDITAMQPADVAAARLGALVSNFGCLSTHDGSRESCASRCSVSVVAHLTSGVRPRC